MAFSDRCGAAWRSTGGGTIGVLVPMVRQVPCTRVRQCNLLLFQQLSAVHDDAIRHWRILHQKSILPSGADDCAAGRPPIGAPAPPPAYLMTAVSVSSDGSCKRGSLGVLHLLLRFTIRSKPGPVRCAGQSSTLLARLWRPGRSRPPAAPSQRVKCGVRAPIAKT
jgi:hypothetical protein